MRDLLREATVHGFVAAAFVAALLELWAIRDPRLRIRLRFLVLLAPLVLPALFLAVAPHRMEAPFRSQTALFDSSRWGRLDLAGVAIDTVVLAVCGAVGAAMFLRDALPLVARNEGRGLGRARAPSEVPAVVGQRVARLARAMGIAPPSVTFVEDDDPVLCCAGTFRPSVCVSGSLVEQLDTDELDAALAHEIAHVFRRDPARGWVLMGIRTALFFHPMVQLAAREIARDVERIADDVAVDVTGRPTCLASAMLKLHGTHDGALEASSAGSAVLEALGRFSARWSSVELASRCRRMLDGRHGSVSRFAGARVVLAAGGVILVLYYVV